MTTYNLVDVFSYSDLQLRTILEMEINDSNREETRKLLIISLLNANLLDNYSNIIASSDRFWNIFDMTESELNIRSNEESRLHKILDIFSTPDTSLAKVASNFRSVVILDRPLLYDDILDNILLNTTNLRTIMELYQSSKYYQNKLNDVHFLRHPKLLAV